MLLERLSVVYSDVDPLLAIAGFFWIISGVLLSLPWPSQGTQGSPYLGIAVLFLAFFFARNSGVLFNRLIDSAIDAKNPRTSGRMLPSGKVFAAEIAVQACSALLIFLGLTFFFPPHLRCIALFVAFIIIGYSFTKRFTFLCHYILGLAHFCLPLTGSLWVLGDIRAVPASVWCASLAALFSAASFDVFYSLQDELFDRNEGLYSVPARFGRARAIFVAQLGLCSAMLLATGALLFHSIAIAPFAAWLLVSAAVGFLWRSFSRSQYHLSGSMFPLLLLFLPLLFTFVVFLQWIVAT